MGGLLSITGLPDRGPVRAGIPIAANAPLTIRTFKAGAVELRKHESERDVARLDALVARCFESEDYAEGRRAFMEKRKPSFKGR